jgi:hypothetical protein
VAVHSSCTYSNDLQPGLKVKRSLRPGLKVKRRFDYFFGCVRTELLVSHDGLDDASTSVTIPGAPAVAASSASPATASHRNRKKPPRWLQTQCEMESETEGGKQGHGDDEKRNRRVPPDVERLVVPGEDAVQRVAEGPLAAVVPADELVVAQVVRQLLERRQPWQRRRLLCFRIALLPRRCRFMDDAHAAVAVSVTAALPAQERGHGRRCSSCRRHVSRSVGGAGEALALGSRTRQGKGRRGKETRGVSLSLARDDGLIWSARRDRECLLQLGFYSE